MIKNYWLYMYYNKFSHKQSGREGRPSPGPHSPRTAFSRTTLSQEPSPGQPKISLFPPTPVSSLGDLLVEFWWCLNLGP